MKKVTKKQLRGLKTGYNEYTKKFKDNLNNYVVNYFLDEEKEYMIGKMIDTVTHGCISGLIGSLCYYEDTIKFFNKYADDIDNLVYDYQQEIGTSNYIDTINSLNHDGNIGDMSQLKNFLAWFGFETVTRQLLDKLEVEY